MFLPDYDFKKAGQDFQVVLRLDGSKLTPEDEAEFLQVKDRLHTLSSRELLNAVIESMRSGVRAADSSSTGYRFFASQDNLVVRAGHVASGGRASLFK